ncbi:MAG: hypothetical protein J5546_09265, partial [Lachnospiraceae bacterium]|nr:hypothetical protein [Lachnospiraceae bacterium]
MKKTRYVIATGIMVLGLLSLLIGTLIHKNATTEGQHMNSTNYDSFQPGDRVTVGYDFIVGAKDLGGGLHFAVFLDEDANVLATYAVKNYEAGAKEFLVSEEGVPYDQFTGKIFALTEKQADAVYPTANMFNKVLKEHNPDASIFVDEELRASIKYGIKLYSKTDARPFIYTGWALFTAGGVALLYMLLRLRFSREVTPAILSILVPVAGAIWWLVHARELGKFSFVRLFKGLRLLFLNYTVMEPSYQCMMLLLLLSLVVLAILYPFCRRKRKRRKLWAISCGIPCLMAAVYAIANFVRGKNECTNERHIVFLVTALLILLWGLAIARTKRFKLCTAYLVVILLVAYTVNAVYIYTHVWSIYVANHTRDGWEKSFEKTIDDLSKAYILRDWKEIDFEALKEKYLPIVREAQEAQDKAGFIVALYELKYDLADGHVMVDAKDNKAWTEAIDRIAGNDYGLSMFRDKDGNFVAVMVEEQSEAESSGIKNGTIITKWDGVPVEEAAASVRCVYHKSFAYAESEWLMQPLFLAGKGGDKIKVTYLNDKGVEYNISLKKIGSYRERLDRAIDLIYREAETQQAVNYSTRMLNDHIGYLRITESQYDKNSTIAT